MEEGIKCANPKFDSVPSTRQTVSNDYSQLNEAAS